MHDDDFYYYAIVSKDGRFDCILDMSAFETEQQCQDAIVKAKKLDEEAGWYYEYSKPKVIKIVTKDTKPLE